MMTSALSPAQCMTDHSTGAAVRRDMSLQVYTERCVSQTLQGQEAAIPYLLYDASLSSKQSQRTVSQEN